MVASTNIDKCRVCDSSEIVEVLDLGLQPLANDLRSDPAQQQVVIPLVLCRCASCGTVQLTETVEPEILFKEYVWVTGTSSVAQAYSDTFFRRITSRIDKPQSFVLEVASNDGTFLKPFVNNGYRVIGVDPAENIADLANKSGIETIPKFFGLDVAEEVIRTNGLADIVFARNVIPHVANAKDVIAGMERVLSPDGLGAIEFHRADKIMSELHYDSIYHEHLYFHSIDSLTRLLHMHDLFPFDIDESPISGGSYVIYFRKEKQEPSDSLQSAIKKEADIGLVDAGCWIEFGNKSKQHRDSLRDILIRLKKEGKSIIGYGASARSSTLLNFCSIDHSFLDCVADKSPLKHGLYTPGTDIRIVSPSEALSQKPDVILLLGWNFSDEILEELVTEHNWTGSVILPLPNQPEVKEVR